MSVLLQLNELTKRYGPVTVLDHVSLDVREGEIHALLGANGAGKSTLCKIIAGLVNASCGSMSLGGRPFCSGNKRAAEQAGVEIVQQELNLVATLTVAENLFLNRLPSFAGVIRKRKLAAHARTALDRFGLQDVATETMVSELGVGRRQMVEIAAALDRRCRLLILDEPTAALSAGETQRLFERLAELRAAGIGIIYISHRLDEVARLSDRVTVLCDGQSICTNETASLTTDRMVELMSGESANVHRDFHSHTTGEPGLIVNGLSGGTVRAVSFSVRRGERLGIAGLVGCGRTEMLRLMFGADVAEAGSVQIGRRPPERFNHPAKAVAAGLAMVTEDRKQNGLLLSESIRVNTTLCSIARLFANFGVIRKSRERQAALDMVDRLRIKCNQIEQPAGTLSGGNQQKVVVSKWLVQDADVFFFDEPTRGIDVSARRRIYQLLDALAESGKTIVIVSSDLDELMDISDRIGVMSAGRWMGEFDRSNWSADAIMQAAFAGYKQSGSAA